MDDDNNHISDSENSDTDSTDSDFVNMAYKYDMRDCELRYSGDPEDDLDSFITKFKNYAALRDYTAEKQALAIVEALGCGIKIAIT